MTVGGSRWVRALIPEMSSIPARVTEPVLAFMCTASMIKTKSGENRLMGPVKFSGAGPASTIRRFG